jgi:hypothetical protein
VEARGWPDSFKESLEMGSSVDLGVDVECCSCLIAALTKTRKKKEAAPKFQGRAVRGSISSCWLCQGKQDLVLEKAGGTKEHFRHTRRPTPLGQKLVWAQISLKM